MFKLLVTTLLLMLPYLSATQYEKILLLEGDYYYYDFSPYNTKLAQDGTVTTVSDPNRGLTAKEWWLFESGVPAKMRDVTELSHYNFTVMNGQRTLVGRKFLKMVGRKSIGEWLALDQNGGRVNINEILRDSLTVDHIFETNDQGQLLGAGQLPDSQETVGFLYDLSSKKLEIFDIERGDFMELSPLGQVISEGGRLYIPEQGWTDLRPLNPFKEGSCEIVDFDETGFLVGNMSDDESSNMHAFLYSPKTGIQFLVFSKSSKSTKAIAMNNHNEVVGVARKGGFSNAKCAFYWSKKSGFIDMGTVGGMKATPFAINNQGTVVGSLKNGDKRSIFLWTREKGMVDLSRCIVGGVPCQLMDVVALNDHGEILVVGVEYSSEMDGEEKILRSNHFFYKLVPID